MAPSYDCELCHKSFPRKSVLDDHINLHFGAKPYQCRHCSSSFANSGTRYQHERTHKTRKFTCTCGKAFARPQELKRHKDRGTGLHIECHREADALPETIDDLEQVTSDAAQAVLSDRLLAHQGSTSVLQARRKRPEPASEVGSHDPWTVVYLDSNNLVSLATTLGMKSLANAMLCLRMYTGGVSQAELLSMTSNHVNETIQACNRLADIESRAPRALELAFVFSMAAQGFVLHIENLARDIWDTNDQRTSRFQDSEGLESFNDYMYNIVDSSRRLHYNITPNSEQDIEILSSALVNFHLSAKETLQILSANRRSKREVQDIFDRLEIFIRTYCRGWHYLASKEAYRHFYEPIHGYQAGFIRGLDYIPLNSHIFALFN